MVTAGKLWTWLGLTGLLLLATGVPGQSPKPANRSPAKTSAGQTSRKSGRATTSDRSATIFESRRGEDVEEPPECAVEKVTGLPGSHGYAGDFIEATAMEPGTDDQDVFWALTADL